MALTITEALAEIKTINKRLASKRQFVTSYLWRQEALKDPLEGGSAVAIKRERQAILDLEERIVALRIAIDKANNDTAITVAGQTRTIQQWLSWRRDVAPGQSAFLGEMRNGIARMRQDAARKSLGVFEATGAEGKAKPQDIVVNIDEATLAAETEKMEEVLGALDGQLSLRNATTMIDA